MRFRPCIDIHNGNVKQIVGGSLKDDADYARDNYVSDRDGAYYSDLYYEKGLRGGHVILLNHEGSPYYEESRRQMELALSAHPGFLQAGGGVNPENAEELLNAGASHVIVTSYVFRDGHIDMARLDRMLSAVGREHLVLDLSCKEKDGEYYIVTDRWQKMTDTVMNTATLDELSSYCDEFLVHAADVEGMQKGISESVAAILGAWARKPITYAGGVHSIEDIHKLGDIGQGRIDVTVGSALDIFGGPLSMEKVIEATESIR
ncbi:phosphoribosylformimino-5-aminoimidazole carboxamide ribotide isomerase [Butyrivibrio sp. MC2013]|uniref:phosphoribosylformimino-5-aminoimidazole carboxamide ribotide isomerase n=1 Tax=Butyrivibrio sp. MC2013 TaxID=1280686 RepID=UPI0004128BFA|nr:phosphoribosylformimino-5-aminoimidazole carboxamide ribotide isomerase [Butyrivibrio sp. MC2013]